MDCFDVACLVCDAVDESDLMTLYNVNRIYRRAVLRRAKNKKVIWYNVRYIPDSLMASLPEIFNCYNTDLVNYIICYQRVSERFVFKLFEYPDFMIVYYKNLVIKQILSRDAIEYIIRNFNDGYYLLIHYQKLDDSQLRFVVESDKVVDYAKSFTMWNNISNYQELTPEFIEDYYDSLNWFLLSSQNLKESTISQFSDYVHWENIFQYQVLSEPFITKYMHRIKNPNKIIKYQKVSREFILKHHLLFDPLIIKEYIPNHFIHPDF